MSHSISHLMLVATVVGLSGCNNSVEISQGGSPVEVRGKDLSTSGDNGGGGGGGGGGDYDAISGQLYGYLPDFGCDIGWYVEGSAQSCTGCDYSFDVSADTSGGSCGFGSSRSGDLEVAYGAMYFDGDYLGSASVSGNSLFVETMGYVTYYYYYDIVYYGSFSMY